LKSSAIAPSSRTFFDTITVEVGAVQGAILKPPRRSGSICADRHDPDRHLARRDGRDCE
jgi:hypothetical protein